MGRETAQDCTALLSHCTATSWLCIHLRRQRSICAQGDVINAQPSSPDPPPPVWKLVEVLARNKLAIIFFGPQHAFFGPQHAARCLRARAGACSIGIAVVVIVMVVVLVVVGVVYQSMREEANCDQLMNDAHQGPPASAFNFLDFPILSVVGFQTHFCRPAADQ